MRKSRKIKKFDLIKQLHLREEKRDLQYHKIVEPFLPVYIEIYLPCENLMSPSSTARAIS